jgi:hypothetical protein
MLGGCSLDFISQLTVCTGFVLKEMTATPRPNNGVNYFQSRKIKFNTDTE